MYDCIIIGAGPSGLMCSSQIKNRKVLLIEKNNLPGKKLMLTGNGRCNITNLKDNNNFLENIYNKMYLYSAINTFGPDEIYNYFINNNCPLKEEQDNKIFPISDKALDILNVLKDNNKNKVHYNEKVLSIKEEKDYKVVKTNKSNYKTKKLVIATGGASFPQTGSTGDHMLFAKQINQKTISLTPKEVGVIIKDNLNLEGISLQDVTVLYKKFKSQGALMFTNHGISASAIMNISGKLKLEEDNIIKLDLCPNKDNIYEMIKEFDKDKEIESMLNTIFPKKLSNYLTKKINISNRKIKTLTKKEIENLNTTIKSFQLEVLRKDDLKKAFVTGGGIDMKDIDSTSFESKTNKDIYFIGESLDIDGPIGGYNLTLALSTGYLAGSKINNSFQ